MRRLPTSGKKNCSMRIDILTLFPGMFAGPFSDSIIKRAIDHALVNIQLHNIRDYTRDKHHIVDDYPFGGGGGMLMKPEPLFKGVESVLKEIEEQESGSNDNVPVVLLSPQGRIFNQKIAAELAAHDNLLLICGHYEGVDERVREHLATDEISIGDYVLTGGELPAMVVLDTVVRLIPGVLTEGQWMEDTHASGLLKYPEYTRPAEYRGWKVPDILLSGNHAEVAKWRRRQSLLRTQEGRPDLLRDVQLTATERLFLEEAAKKQKREALLT